MFCYVKKGLKLYIFETFRERNLNITLGATGFNKMFYTVSLQS